MVGYFTTYATGSGDAAVPLCARAHASVPARQVAAVSHLPPSACVVVLVLVQSAVHADHTQSTAAAAPA